MRRANVTYTISVTNFGPSVAGGVVVTDALPAGVSFVSASGNGTTNGHVAVATWDLSGDAGGQPGDEREFDGEPAGECACERCGDERGVCGADERAAESAESAGAGAGDERGGRCGDERGACERGGGDGVYERDHGDECGAECGDERGGVGRAAWRGDDERDCGVLPAGGVTNIYVVEVAPGSGPLTNVASATPGTYDPNLLNNTNVVVINVTPVANVVVGKVANVAGAYAGANVTYTISVTNFGPSVAGGVVVTDALPAGVSFVSASGNGTTNGRRWRRGI
jgi:uncharacterized repeat protein (TIGR01451 family)